MEVVKIRTAINFDKWFGPVDARKQASYPMGTRRGSFSRG